MSKPKGDLVKRLRKYSDQLGGITDEAADMLEFFFGQMQMHSPKMNGQHSWRFSGGWPMTHCVGPNSEDAVKAAMQEMNLNTEEQS